MIDEIRVENLALIREASLVPCSGLTVLTGETGAGKTALLSAEASYGRTCGRVERARGRGGPCSGRAIFQGRG